MNSTSLSASSVSDPIIVAIHGFPEGSMEFPLEDHVTIDDFKRWRNSSSILSKKKTVRSYASESSQEGNNAAKEALTVSQFELSAAKVDDSLDTSFTILQSSREPCEPVVTVAASCTGFEKLSINNDPLVLPFISNDHVSQCLSRKIIDVSPVDDNYSTVSNHDDEPGDYLGHLVPCWSPPRADCHVVDDTSASLSLETDVLDKNIKSEPSESYSLYASTDSTSSSISSESTSTSTSSESRKFRSDDVPRNIIASVSTSTPSIEFDDLSLPCTFDPSFKSYSLSACNEDASFVSSLVDFLNESTEDNSDSPNGLKASGTPISSGPPAKASTLSLDSFDKGESSQSSSEEESNSPVPEDSQSLDSDFFVSRSRAEFEDECSSDSSPSSSSSQDDGDDDDSVSIIQSELLIRALLRLLEEKLAFDRRNQGKQSAKPPIEPSEPLSSAIGSPSLPTNEHVVPESCGEDADEPIQADKNDSSPPVSDIHSKLEDKPSSSGALLAEHAVAESLADNACPKECGDCGAMVVKPGPLIRLSGTVVSLADISSLPNYKAKYRNFKIFPRYFEPSELPFKRDAPDYLRLEYLAQFVDVQVQDSLELVCDRICMQHPLTASSILANLYEKKPALEQEAAPQGLGKPPYLSEATQLVYLKTQVAPTLMRSSVSKTLRAVEKKHGLLRRIELSKDFF